MTFILFYVKIGLIVCSIYCYLFGKRDAFVKGSVLMGLGLMV